MNYRGSYQKLLGNSQAAIMAAIELYNKPLFHYRDECVVILLLNAWELLLKAILSIKGQSVFYKKKRKEPYRTLSWNDALTRAERYFPTSIGRIPVRKNLELLGTYRDNSVHFYNAKGFGILLYALSQTCIMNYRDLLSELFNIKLENAINWQLLPIGIKPPMDAITYISSHEKDNTTGAVRQFIAELSRANDEIKKASSDTGRLLTVFNVKLESVKKIGDSDVIVGVYKTDINTGPLAIIRTQDPNVTHPLRQKDIVHRIGTIYGRTFTDYQFQAIVWKYGLKENSQYCWRAKEGVLIRYSKDIVAYIQRLCLEDIDKALMDYRSFLRSRKKQRKVKK